MDVIDRVSATDRAVAAYRRFVDTNELNVVPDMVSDLLHWHRIMLDRRVSVDALRGILDSALDQYTSELERFGIGDDPLTGNRREPNARWRDNDPEPVYAPRSEYASFAENVVLDMPIPESALLDDDAGHPGYDFDAGCNCLECMEHRAIERGFIDTGGGWVPRDMDEPTSWSQEYERAQEQLLAFERARTRVQATWSPMPSAEEDEIEF